MKTTNPTLDPHLNLVQTTKLTRKILVVDNKTQVAKLIVLTLRRLEYPKIEVAHNGKGALRIAEYAPRTGHSGF